MRFTSLLTLSGLASSIVAAPPAALPYASAKSPVVYAQLQGLIAGANAATRARAGQGIPGSACTPDNIRVRRKWDSLSPAERIAFSSAVRCMQTTPSKSPPEWAPGAKTRYDDFVASHISQHFDVHFSGKFLEWHRWILASFEYALRDECGYQGSLPYWDWALTAMTGLEASPLFDGSETSMGGNGEFIPGRTEPLYYPRFKNSSGDPIVRPTGTGGGCVTTGPFVNYTVNFGPHYVPLSGPGNFTPPFPDRLGYNPRCLTRDLTDAINQEHVNARKIVDAIVQSPNRSEFQLTFEIGVHADGHIMVGGDPGTDIGGNGPAEPTFWLIHSSTDLYWWVWQNQDPEKRIFGADSVTGTNTGLDLPPSDPITLDSLLHLDYANALWNETTVREIISTVDGDLCYVYE